MSGIDDLMVVRARCCNPIRGEKIVGYITRGKGVSVHSALCPNVMNLLYDPERRIDVEWDSAADASRYIVRLTMQVEDRKGILADVSSRIAAINTNITNVEATGADSDHLGRINMAVEIKDVKHLEKVIKLLQRRRGSARRRTLRRPHADLLCPTAETRGGARDHFLEREFPASLAPLAVRLPGKLSPGTRSRRLRFSRRAAGVRPGWSIGQAAAA